jgi:hypothetical protein
MASNERPWPEKAPAPPVQAQPAATDHAPRWPLAAGEHEHGLEHGLDHEHGTAPLAESATLSS